MDQSDIGLLGFGAVLLLLAMRVPIAIGLSAVAVIGISILNGPHVALAVLRTAPFEFAANFHFSAIPMFLLMGAIMHNAGITTAVFRAARLWLSEVPGSLAVATNFACAGFAAASGSTVATAAAMGRIAIPEMDRAGYDPGLATGVVASAGTLGSMIPPSIGFVLYGIFAEVSIAKLFIAGILPGLLTAIIYAAMVITRCTLNPQLAPRLQERPSWSARVHALRDIWPLLLLVFTIMYGLYGGIVTPTEAGAFGTFVSLLIAFAQRRLTFKLYRDSLYDAMSGTCKIFFIAIGVVLLSRFLAMAGTVDFLRTSIGSWGTDPILLVLVTSLIYLVLGMFLDGVGLMLLTLPLLLPMFEALDLDLIWFGVLVIKYTEISLLTPPVGLNVYVVKTVVGDKIALETIFRGAGWFLACEVVIVGLLVTFKDISLFLPSLM